MRRTMITLTTLATLQTCSFPVAAFTCDDPLKTDEEVGKCLQEQQLGLLNDDFEEYYHRWITIPNTLGSGSSLAAALSTNKPRCSDNVMPGTVIQTMPPIYNCTDLKEHTTDHLHLDKLAELERKIVELQEKLERFIDKWTNRPLPD